VLSGNGEDNTLNGRAGNDTLNGGVGIDEAAYWDASGSVNVSLSTGQAGGADGNDTLASIENLYGSSFADVLTGDSANNLIAGSSGNDRIEGGAGADSLDGGEGDDTLDGGDGDDELQGGDGNDTLQGGSGVDTVLFNGPELNYQVTSLGPGAWRIEDKVGLEGIDNLTGIERLSFVIVGTLDGSTLTGGAGFDIASYEAANSAVTVNLDQGLASGSAGRNTLSSIEGAIGSAAFGDTLIGDTRDNQLEGLGGNDRLDGGAGSDDLDGGTGADTLIGGTGADRYVVDDALDQVIELDNALGLENPNRPGLDLGQTIDKVVASVSFSLGSFVENLELAGAAGDLAGSGNALDNLLTGNEGNNRFVGAGGNDSIDGRAGVDTAVYSGARSGYQLSRGADTFTVQASGDEGTDTLRATERLEFAGLGVALDTQANEAGGQTALLIGAVLGVAALTSKPAVVGSVLNLFDQGFTLRELSGAVMRLPIWDALAGGSDNTSVARYLLGNVLGAAPDAALLATATSYMDNTAQGDLLWLLAGLPVNQAQVNLVGLAQTGLEFSL
jgi:Ca2+-binding RTX toxin-like protein